MKIMPFALLLIATCAPLPQPLVLDETVEYPTQKSFNAPRDAVFNAAIAALQQFPIILVDRESGVISTDWRFYIDYKRIKIWRGKLYGGYVEDKAPMDVKDRLTLKISQETDGTILKINRSVAIRAFNMEIGPVGSWSRNERGDYYPTTSNTKVENDIIQAVEKAL
jgi:hypothetical protein